jgi:hypothetical protein
MLAATCDSRDDQPGQHMICRLEQHCMQHITLTHRNMHATALYEHAQPSCLLSVRTCVARSKAGMMEAAKFSRSASCSSCARLLARLRSNTDASWPPPAAYEANRM